MKESLNINKSKVYDIREFNNIYDKYYTKIFKVVYSKIGNRVDCEDLVQETFVKVFKNLKFYDCNKGDFYNFILLNCKQVIADYYKVKIPRKEKVEEVELDENIKIELDLDIESEYDLVSAINSLPEDQCVAFKLIYMENLSYSDVAKIMNKSESSVKSLAFRARKTLRKEIIKNNPEIGKHYGFKEVLKIFVISAVCVGLVSGFAYAMYRVYLNRLKKENYTLNEVFTDVPDENSKITRGEAVSKINGYLEILGIEDRVNEDELHLIRDYELLEECWKVENEEFMMKINAKDGGLVLFNRFNISNTIAREAFESLLIRLGVEDSYELYNLVSTNNYDTYIYAKKYGDIFNLYQRITIVVNHGVLCTFSKLDYEFEDKEIKISREEAIRIAEENGIAVESVELVIEKLDNEYVEFLEVDENIDVGNYNMYLPKNYIRKGWRIEGLKETYFVDSYDGRIVKIYVLEL